MCFPPTLPDRLAGLTALCLVLAGCASLRPLSAPDLTITDLRLVEITALETSARIDVRIANTNPEPLRVTGGVFRISLNGVRIGQALSNEAIVVPALGSVVQSVDLYINNVALATRLRPIFQSGMVDYRLKAKVYATGTFGTRTLRVSNDGSFRLPESWDGSLDRLTIDSDVSQPLP